MGNSDDKESPDSSFIQFQDPHSGFLEPVNASVLLGGFADAHMFEK